MTPLPVIVTRAEPGATETAARLSMAGYTPVVSPVLAIQPIAQDEPVNLDGVQGLLFTSANGVRAFADVYEGRDQPAYCVGPATLAAALEAGFESVLNADGNAKDLAALVCANSSPDGGRLLHVANEAAAGDLASELRANGFDVNFLALYRAAPAQSLMREAAELIRAGSSAAVLIHSAKGATRFTELCRTSELDTSSLAFAAVSEKAAEPLTDLSPARLEIAEKPNEDALFDALECIRLSL